MVRWLQRRTLNERHEVVIIRMVMSNQCNGGATYRYERSSRQPCSRLSTRLQLVLLQVTAGQKASAKRRRQSGREHRVGRQKKRLLDKKWVRGNDRIQNLDRRIAHVNTRHNNGGLAIFFRKATSHALVLGQTTCRESRSTKVAAISPRISMQPSTQHYCGIFWWCLG